MLYIIADSHFGHEKIILYENRPFESVFQMNRVMIDNWNRVVCDDDIVIHLGDFSLLPPQETIDICQELKGRIILFNGNHDHRTRTFWEQQAGILKWFKRPQYLDGIWLTHRVDWGFLFYDTLDPFKIWTGKNSWTVIKYNDLVLHGHSHGKIIKQGQFINCGVDACNFTPAALPSFLKESAINKIQNWIEKIMLVSMDMSMRSSGLVALTPSNIIIGLNIIKTTLDDFPDHEDTIIHVVDAAIDFIAEFSADAFVIEGLSHGAKSAHKDVIAGIFWGIRIAIWRKFPEMPIGVVPVTSWRSKVLNKEDRKYAKENYSPKNDAIKIATVKKLPAEIHKYFIDYIEGMHLPKKSIYDLTDAYFLGYIGIH